MSARTSRAPDLPITFGKFVLRERIGKGGMAEIFRAKVQGASGFEKEVVIKRMLPALCDDPGFTDMMVREAKILVSLKHQNIVQVYELGEVDGRYYIAMEYIHGRDLRAVLARCAEVKRPFPIPIATSVVLEVLRALEYAHRVPSKDGRPLELVHRDVSPTNLMVSFEGEVKVLDFGIAKVDVGDFVTREGLIKGNCPYMSPEQVAGGDLDQRSDLFSLGSTFYEMLTGKRAFEAPTYIAVMQRIWADEPARIEELRTDIPPGLANLIHRMLEKDRARRFPTAVDLHAGLLKLVERKELTIGTPFEVAAFMRDIFGEASLVERRSIPDEDRVPMETVRAESTRPGTEGRLVSKHDGGTMPMPLRETPRPGSSQPPARVSRGTLALRKIAPGGRPHWTFIAVASALLGAVIFAAIGGTRDRDRSTQIVAQREQSHDPVGPHATVLTAAPQEVRQDPVPDRPHVVKTMPMGTGYLKLGTFDEHGQIWAQVWIDNQLVAEQTPLVNFPVEAGVHWLKVKNPAYPAKQIRLRVRRGQVTNQFIDLRPDAAAPPAP
jgi:serine/threonine protein kinase